MKRTISHGGIRRVALLAAVFACGCSSYIPLCSLTPIAGGDARITLSLRASEVAYGPIGSAVRQIEGRIISVGDSTLDVAVTGVTRITGFDESWSGQRVSVARGYITSIEAKQFSVPRTLGTIGAVVAGGFLAHGTIAGGEGTSSGVKKPGGGN